MEEKILKNQLLEELKQPKNIKANIKNVYFKNKHANEKPWYKNKLFYFLSSSALVVAGGVALIIVPALTTASINTENQTILNTVNTDNAFAYQTATSLGMFNASTSSTTNSVISYSRHPDGDKTNECVAEQLIPYLPAVEGALLGTSVLNEVTYDTPSEGYDYKLIVTTYDLLGNEETFIMEYIETLIEHDHDHEDYVTGGRPDKDHGDDKEPPLPEDEELPPQPEDDLLEKHPGDGNHPPKGGHHFDDDTEFLIQGIIIKDEITYNLLGVREVDEEDGELEMMLKYGLPDETTKDGISIENFVLVEQEIEDDEIKYQYVIVEELQIEHAYSLEVEKNHVHLSTFGEEGFTRIRFELFEKDENIVIKAFYGSRENMSLIFFFKESDGTYSYRCPHVKNSTSESE